MLVWIVCGVLTLFGALVCAELASAFPQTGGVYVFLRDTFSPLAGFLWGWAMFWSMHSGIVAAIAVVFARYCAFFLPIGDTGVRVVAVLVILALSALNYAGVRAGGRVQTALTGAKLAAIAAVVVVGVMASTGDRPAPPPARCRPRGERRRSTISCWPSSPASSPTADGTWSPTRREKRGWPPGRSLSRSSSASGSSRSVRRAESRLPAHSSARRAAIVDARGRRCRRCGARPGRIGRAGRARLDLVDRRADRHRADRAARVLFDGAGRARAPMARLRPSRVSDAARAPSSRRRSGRACWPRPARIVSSSPA